MRVKSRAPWGRPTLFTFFLVFKQIIKKHKIKSTREGRRVSHRVETRAQGVGVGVEIV